MFITFEGTEGSGKSLQARLLVDRLRLRGVRVLQTHEPGGTALGDQVRQLVLLRDDLQVGASRSAADVYLAGAACGDGDPARAERGEVVVCDRFADSTLVYQGAGPGSGYGRRSSR